MSFNLPRNVPSFDDPIRPHEDKLWAGSKRNKSTGNGHANANVGIAGKLGLANQKELPMYKDKPYNYASSNQRSPIAKKRRNLVLITLLVVGLLYWIGHATSERDGTKSKTTTGSWNPLAKQKSPPVDWEARRQHVKDAFKISWNSYEKHGWGMDVYRPESKDGKKMTPKGMGWIIVDALDTLMLMNLTTQLSHAREWISTSLDYDQDHEVNTFETTIRMLGGLLSAHHLSTSFPDMAPVAGNDDLYIEKASDLADRLLGAFDSDSGIPYASVNLQKRQGVKSHIDGGASSTAEAASVQLEMKYMAKLTGEVEYWNRAEHVMKVIDDNNAPDGLVPIFIYAERGVFRGNNIRLGSRGDSYYEYLLKQYLQTSKQEPIYLSMWDQALAGIRKHLVTYSFPSNFLIVAERPNGLNRPLVPKMDHLVCFLPGTIALGATGGLSLREAKKDPSWGPKQEEEMALARQLMKTCWGMNKVAPTGLAPEIAHFHFYTPPHMMEDGVLASPQTLDPSESAAWRQDFNIKRGDTHNLQRPETVESLFYMWRITGEEMYRGMGWEIFSSFIEHTFTEDRTAFTSIANVMKIPPPSRNNMESFWLAETLKYLYLLFGPDDILPLDQVVFNTEAHVFPRFDLGKLFGTGWRRKRRDAEGNIIPSAREEVRKAGVFEGKKATETSVEPEAATERADDTDGI